MTPLSFASTLTHGLKYACVSSLGLAYLIDNPFSGSLPSEIGQMQSLGGSRTLSTLSIGELLHNLIAADSCCFYPIVEQIGFQNCPSLDGSIPSEIGLATNLSKSKGGSTNICSFIRVYKAPAQDICILLFMVLQTFS